MFVDKAIIQLNESGDQNLKILQDEHTTTRDDIRIEMDQHFDNIQKTIYNEYTLIKELFAEFKSGISSRQEKVEIRVNRKVVKFKDICSQFFEKIESSAHRNDDLILKIKDSYETFKKVTMDPFSQSDSRLFVLEARFKESERERQAEFYYLKDIIQKIV